MSTRDRRDLLKRAAALGLGTLISARNASPRAGRVSIQAGPNPATAKFFPGFKQLTAKTSGATINFVTAGSGPPLLLLHGYPETHIMWRRVAPQLAEKFTVVAADLRGYGDSSKPPDGENHFNHSKRAMAQDQVELMASLGFLKFSVVGHDRGGRVTHRMALDHPDRVEKAVVLDIVPTYKLFHNVTKEWATSSFHWFFLIQPTPIPETLIGNSFEFWVQSRFTRFNRLPAEARSSDAIAEYVRCFRIPGTIHATCEDYRAGASIDLEHDEAVELRLDAEVMETFTRKQVHWTTQADQIYQIRQHTNDLAKVIQQLNEVRETASPWQQQAIDKLNPMLKDLVASVNSMIHCVEDQVFSNIGAGAYRECVRNNYKISVEMAGLITDFVDYGRNKEKFLEQGRSLDLSAHR